MALAGAFSLAFGGTRIAGIAISDALFLATAILFLLSSGKRPQASPAFQIAAALAVLATVGGAIAAVNPGESLQAGIRLLYVWTVWQWGIRSVTHTTRRVLLLLKAFGIGASLSGVAGIAQAAGLLASPSVTEFHGRTTGLQGHPNAQGGLLAAALTVSFVLMLTRGHRAPGILMSIACAGGLIGSGSVSGMIGALVGVLAVFVLARMKFGSWVIVVLTIFGGAVAVLALPVIFPGAVDPFVRLLDATGAGQGEGSLASRLLTVQYALSQVSEHPIFGVGLDAASGGTFNGQTLAHNVLVLFLYQGGVALLVALLMVLVLASRAVLLAKAASDPGRIAAAASAIAVFTVAMSGPVLYDRWFWFPILVAIASNLPTLAKAGAR